MTVSRELSTAERRNVRAMGSLADIVVVGPADRVDELADRALRRLADLEARWTRFSPDSEVSRYNRGDRDAVGEDTALLLARAREGYELTHGRFDPYRLADIVAIGYDRARVPGTDDGPVHPDAGFDPGGIGKGLAADIVSAELVDDGAAGALVSIGGDLRVRGSAPDGGHWSIDVEDPRTGGVVATVQLAEGAVATSSQLKRRWTGEDGERHHLIDPSTGTSSHSPVLSATIVAAEAWQAEVLTKVAFLDALGQGALSDDAGFGLVEAVGAAALVVTADLVLTTSRWVDFAVETGVAA